MSKQFRLACALAMDLKLVIAFAVSLKALNG